MISTTRRVADHPFATGMANRLMSNKVAVDQSYKQATTGSKSDTYTGLHTHIGHLLSLQQQWKFSNNYVDQNKEIKSKNQFFGTATENIHDTITDMINMLSQVGESNGVNNATEVQALQEMAWNSLGSMEMYINQSSVVGLNLGGTNTTDNPVKLDLGDSIKDFQRLYDGRNTTYPTTALGNTSSMAITSRNNGSWAEMKHDPNGLDSIIDTTGLGKFANFQSGQTIRLKGSGGNDKLYTIDHIGPKANSIFLKTEETVAENSATPVTFKSEDDELHEHAETYNGVSFSPKNNTVPLIGNPEDGVIHLPAPKDDDKTLRAGENLQFDNLNHKATAPMNFFTDSKGNPLSDGTTMTVNGQTITLSGVSADGKTATFSSSKSVADVNGPSLPHSLVVHEKSSFAEMHVGDIVNVSGSLNNNGNKAITGISPDGLTMTVEQKTLQDSGSPAHPYFNHVLTPSNPLTLFDNGSRNDSASAKPGTFLLDNGDPISDGTELTIDGQKLVVKSVSGDGSTITFADGYNVAPKTLGGGTVTSNRASITVESSGYYQGNNQEVTYHLSDTRNVTQSINATYAPFEKTIRALGIIAQGDLKHHPERLKNATYLLQSALDRSSVAGQKSPYGYEDPATIADAGYFSGFVSSSVKTNMSMLQDRGDALESEIEGITQVDQTKAAMEYKSLYQMQQASYAMIGKLQGMSLLKYMS